MPQTTQIVPEHDYPHVMVVEHDNSARPNDKLEPPLETYCNMMCVFVSPKGIDRKFQTITRGFKGFKEAYGIGSYDVYGQPYLNAYAAAKTDAATLHCLRVTADDATYSMGALVAHYKTTPAITSPDEPEEIIATSDVVDLMGRQNIAAGDDLESDPKVVTVAGLDIEPGISAENETLFGRLKGKYIDVVLDLTKIVGTIDPEATYKIVQENPALAEYYPTDTFVEYNEVGGKYTKTKTYEGKDLLDGYAILLASDQDASGYVVQMGPGEPDTSPKIANDTELTVKTPNDDAITGTISMNRVTGTMNYDAYTVTLGGEMINHSVQTPDQFTDLTGFPQCWEIIVNIPGLDPDTEYVIVQQNPILSQYATDSRVRHDKGLNYWYKKSGPFKGSELDEGFSLLLSNTSAKITLDVFTREVWDAQNEAKWETAKETESVVIKGGSKLINVAFKSLVDYVADYTPPAEPDPVEVEETKVSYKVEAAFTFVGNTSSSAQIRAEGAYKSLNKAATDQYYEDNPPDPFVPTDGHLDLYYTFEAPEIAPTERDNLGELFEVDETTVDEEGYKSLKIFEMVCRGRGTYGDNIRFMLKNYPRGDKLSNFKNYWLNVYEIEDATLYLKETFNVDFIPDALNMDGNALFADYIMGDPFNNSSYVDIKTNQLAMRTLYAEYLLAHPTTGVTYQQFDPLLGMQYGSSLKVLPYLSIDTARPGAVALGGASGIALMGGSNGAFEANMPGRDEAINRAYLKAWTGEIDRNIFSRKMYPTDIILDANYSYDVKRAIARLTVARKDTMTFYDLGTEFNSYNAMLEELAELEADVGTRDEAIEAYWGKIQDPVTYKIIKVTSTYPLSFMYPEHFREQGAKHVALAGSAYGVIQGYISGSPQLVFDDDLDSVEMDEMTELRINYLKVNSLKQIVRATQTTRQELDTNLSECSNVFVLHDIRRDCIIMCEGFEYNFLELSELQRFNKSAEIVAAKYAAAQVRSISAVYDVNEWEYDRGILHLYVEFIHKNLVKRAIVEIDINRGRLMD